MGDDGLLAKLAAGVFPAKAPAEAVMIVTRRGFLQSCLALAAAPAIVRADSLMRVVPRELAVEVGQLDWFQIYESEFHELIYRVSVPYMRPPTEYLK